MSCSRRHAAEYAFAVGESTAICYYGTYVWKVHDVDTIPNTAVIYQSTSPLYRNI